MKVVKGGNECDDEGGDKGGEEACNEDVVDCGDEGWMIDSERLGGFGNRQTN